MEGTRPGFHDRGETAVDWRLHEAEGCIPATATIIAVVAGG